MGLRKNSRASASAATVFWHREDRNRVKLTEASRLANPAAATASCSCPIVMALRLTVEKTSCIELFKKSQPKKLLERIRCGFLYKAVNTMDSMVGYKNDRYLHFGRAAAKLDDVVNFFPARISAFLKIGAAFLGGKSYNGRLAGRVWRRDSRKNARPNSATTESV